MSYKQVKKRMDKKCYFCPCDDYNLLDAHRIIEGGKYDEHNILTCCVMCHRKIHTGYIKIDKKYFSTKGKYILHYWIDGEEKWE